MTDMQAFIKYDAHYYNTESDIESVSKVQATAHIPELSARLIKSRKLMVSRGSCKE